MMKLKSKSSDLSLKKISGRGGEGGISNVFATTRRADRAKDFILFCPPKKKRFRSASAAVPIPIEKLLTKLHHGLEFAEDVRDRR
jgi:hypothetical protein